jgi:hypothetical protein
MRTASLVLPLVAVAALIVVKPNKSGTPGSRFSVPLRGRLVASNVTISELIAAAHGGVFPLRDDQIVGGPGWLRVERFDVEAKLDAGDETKPDELFEPADDAVVSDAFALVRAVLAERFGLVVRRTRRQSAETVRRDRAARTHRGPWRHDDAPHPAAFENPRGSARSARTHRFARPLRFHAHVYTGSGAR